MSRTVYLAAAGRIRRWTARPAARDAQRSLARQAVSVALMCAAVDGLNFLTRGPDPGPWTPVLLAVVIAADVTLATAPRFSGWVAVIHAAVGVALAFVMPGRNPSTAGQLVSSYRAGAWLRGRSSAAALITVCAGNLASMVITGLTAPVTLLGVVAANALLPWLVGRYTTARKEHVEELRRQREATLRDAEAEIAAAVTKERETIAVELHDVISHHVGAIGVHTTAARLNLTGTAVPHDSPVHTSLAAVQQSGQAAMTDLRRLLSLLHDGSDSTDQPGVTMLPELFTNLRASGLHVMFVVYCSPPPLTKEVDITVYRVAQEMMTNVLRHGDGRAARVELDCVDGCVALTARNRVASPAADAPHASPPPGSGLGLRGMRKRAEALGGSGTFGVTTDGNYWQSSVTIPLAGAR
ncbi:sensor histidine kinase [Streptomyces sp. DSM 40484]|uniref:sensor histidine kinase n=1 Tax=Streptomyces kroppenstedtii TaxID=3051181 RepID=UPI0028D0935C|nr:histidine kinase [Streptomyces sp. DSM 40484]